MVGQDLIHLASKGTIFRLQFIQRLLTQPTDLLWRPFFIPLHSAVDGGLGLDSPLFLTDTMKLETLSLLDFIVAFCAVNSFISVVCDAADEGYTFRHREAIF